MQVSVCIVGAGLAGLAVARRLHRASIPFVLIDKSDRVGGRLKTDNVDGFLLDHGFQVLFTAYPYVQNLLDLKALNLRPFEPGALVFDGAKFQRIQQNRPLHTAVSSLFGATDKLRVLNWTNDCKLMSIEDCYSLPDIPTEKYLRDYGFSDAFIDGFARPFFGGIFLDRSLNVSLRQFAFVWKMVSEGDTVVPALGMEEIAKQLAADLPKSSIRLNSKVSEVLRDASGRAVGVKLENGEDIHAEAVVIATESDSASDLSGMTTPKERIGSTCIYFETPSALSRDRILYLLKPNGLVNEVVPVSTVAPETAPPGKHLVSATILGMPELSDAELADAVRTELSPVFPDQGVDAWKLLRVYRIPYAQIRQHPGVWSQRPNSEGEDQGLYLAGEFTEDGSINGALKSGDLLGERLVKTVGAARTR